MIFVKAVLVDFPCHKIFKLILFCLNLEIKEEGLLLTFYTNCGIIDKRTYQIPFFWRYLYYFKLKGGIPVNDKKQGSLDSVDANKGSASRIPNRQLLIALYDVLIYLFVAFLLLIVYNEANLNSTEILFQIIISGVFLFTSRIIFKIYKQIWRYGGIQCYIRLLISDGTAFIVYFLIENLIPIKHTTFVRTLAISCMTLLGSLAIRMVYRYAYKCCRRDSRTGKIMNILLKIFAGKSFSLRNSDFSQKIRIAIIGAGRVGVGLAEELLNNKAASYLPVCFVDTNQEKIGRQIFGLPVLSEKRATVNNLIAYNIQEVVFALPQEDAKKKKELYELYNNLGFKVKVYDYPTVQQAGDKKRHLREFDIEELLFRKPLEVTDDDTCAFYKDKVILITGGGGSIGSELCRQISKMSPKHLIILDVYENGAYDIQQELKIAYGSSLNLCVEIVSVCNKQGLEKVFDTYRPQIVFHAAAHKHVPLMEHNCCEAVENNVFGTLNTVELSEKYGVERFMMVSTDKAVNPTNVMGATKRMCELIVQAHSNSSTSTTFSATRFGNVLGSAGSVIPLFKRQIMNGGPLTITDKRIIRYFMTIPEASQLVLQSGAMAKNGELFVLDMGKPVKILELAESMIRLSGYEPYRDIDIIETGLRPGEKLYEELLVKTEELDKTDNSLIFIERDTPMSLSDLNHRLAILSHAIDMGDDEAAKEALHKVVPTFRLPEEVNADAMQSDEVKMAEGATV